MVVGAEAVKRSHWLGFTVLLVIALLSSTLVTFWVTTASMAAAPAGPCCPEHATASLPDSEVQDPAVSGVRSTPGPSATGIAALDFFTGGGSYMPRTHCLTTTQGLIDWPWIITLLVLTTGVIVSYLRTFVFWMRSYFDEAPGDRNPKLFELGMVFLLCALCGYAMSIVMFVWPGYRLLAVFLLILNIFSWKFCLNLQPFRQAFSSARLGRQLQEAVESRSRELERLVAARTAEVNRLAEIARRTANAVVMTDRHARIEWVNEGFSRITGYSPEEAIGRRPSELLQGPDSDPVEVARMRRAIRAGESVTAELVNYHKSGRPYRIRVDIDPLRDESGELTGFMAIESDVTEQYEYRQELKRRASELERLRNLAESANQAKSEFLANMSHEIRTPMTAILGYADLLAEDIDGTMSPQDRREYITTIKRSGQHLLAVINDILDLSKIEAGKLDVEVIDTSGSASVPTTPAPVTPCSPPLGPLVGRRILLVEDGLDNQRLVALHLRRAGAEVSIAGNGVQALRLMNRDLDGRPAAAAAEGGDGAGNPEYDLVLTDMQMPEMDGYTLARRLREGGWVGPIVALTANAMSGDHQQCIQAGCDAYVAKPIDRSQLLGTCSHVLRSTRQSRSAA